MHNMAMYRLRISRFSTAINTNQNSIQNSFGNIVDGLIHTKMYIEFW